MSYSDVGIANLARQRLGQTTLLSTLADDANVNLVWEYIRDEVLEAGDWNFAKSRVALSKIPPRVELNCGGGKILRVISDKYLSETTEISIEVYTNSADALSVALDSSNSKNILIKLAGTTATNNTAALIQVALRALTTVNGVSVAAWTVTGSAEWTAGAATNGVDLEPAFMSSDTPGNWEYAYLLPSDFLKVAKRKRDDDSVDPSGAYAAFYDSDGSITVRGSVYSYIIESLSDGTKILKTDYDSAQGEVFLVYIRRETDPTKYSASFVNALTSRLAAELSFLVAESRLKFADYMNMYDRALRGARALNQSADFVKDEAGSTAWEFAGR